MSENRMMDFPHLSVQGSHLQMDGHDLCALADRYGTPLYVGSQERIRENIREVREAFSSCWPQVSVHYAAKAESTLAVLQTVRSEGIGVEVNSGGELSKALEAGFSGEQMIFNGCAKSEAEIALAIETGVRAICVDSASELSRIMALSERSGHSANILLRIVPEVHSGVVGGIATGTGESKFGTEMEELPQLLVSALRHPLIHLLGWHFHIGSQTFDLQAVRRSCERVMEFAAAMKQHTGYAPQVLDIGGGLPVPYHIPQEASQYMDPALWRMLQGTLPVQDIARTVTGVLGRYRGELGEPELILEPGRKITADAFVLLGRVESAKHRRGSGDDWLMVDAGINTISEVKTYHWYFPMICASLAAEPHTRPFKVGGPLCESGDVWMDYDTHRDLPDYRPFPEGTGPGDLVAILVTGAYGSVMMNQYNGRPRAGVVLLTTDGRAHLARRPERVQELWALEEKL